MQGIKHTQKYRSSLDPSRSFPRLQPSRLLPLQTSGIGRRASGGRTKGVSKVKITMDGRICSPFRRVGFNAGSCTISALANANVILSACPVTPPPRASAKTLYLSNLPVTLSAHNALSRSCSRGNASKMLFPLIITSPFPSTR